MNRSRKQRPQYPAREGLIISGDPAGRVMERGFAGGRVSRDPADAVAYQAAFVGTATGRYQSPERRPYDGGPDWREMYDVPRWFPSRRGQPDFSPERMHGELPEEDWQQRHHSPHSGFSSWGGNNQRRSRSRERWLGRDGVGEMREDRFSGEFNEPRNWDRPPEDHPFMREDRLPGEFNEPRNWDRPPEDHPFMREDRFPGEFNEPRDWDRPPEDHPFMREDRLPGEFNEPGNWDRPPEHHPFNEFGEDRGGGWEGQRFGIDRSPLRDPGPSRERESPVLSRWDGPRRSRSPRSDRGNPRREHGSPRREMGFESVWGRLGPKYEMSPEPSTRAPSLEWRRRSRSPVNDGRGGGREDPNYDPRNIPPDWGGPENQNVLQPGPISDYSDGPREVQGDPGPRWGPRRPDQSWRGPHERLPEGPRVDDGRGIPRPVPSKDGDQGSGREWVGPHHPGNVVAKPLSEPSLGGGQRENQGSNAPGPGENMLGREEQHSGDESDNALSFEPAYSGGEPSEESDGDPDDPDAEDDGAEEDKNSNDGSDGSMPYWERSVQEWDKPVTEEEINAAAGKPPKSYKTPAPKKDKPAPKKDKSAPKKNNGLFDHDKQAAVVLEKPGLVLEKKDGDYIQTCLAKDVQKAIASGNGPELRFLKSGLIEPGWFLITCGNDETLDWLLKWQPPKVENYTLVVKRRSEVSEYHKIGFWMTSSVELSVPEILKVLKGQNGRLETKNWVPLGSRRGKRGVFQIFLVDSESLQALKSYKWRLCFELHTVQVYRQKHLGKGKGAKGAMKRSTGPGVRQSLGPGPVVVPGPIRQPKPTIPSALTGGFSTGGPFQ